MAKLRAVGQAKGFDEDDYAPAKVLGRAMTAARKATPFQGRTDELRLLGVPALPVDAAAAVEPEVAAFAEGLGRRMLERLGATYNDRRARRAEVRKQPPQGDEPPSREGPPTIDTPDGLLGAADRRDNLRVGDVGELAGIVGRDRWQPRRDEG